MSTGDACATALTSINALRFWRYLSQNDNTADLLCDVHKLPTHGVRPYAVSPFDWSIRACWISFHRQHNNKNMKTILLVEDDKKISMALSLRLRSMGYEVDSASDAVYAMNAAMRCHPEIVLLDINLPGGNGFVVADRMRASRDLCRTPIIFITASKNPEHRLKAAEYGTSMYLEKPFMAVQLTEAIERLVH